MPNVYFVCFCHPAFCGSVFCIFSSFTYQCCHRSSAAQYFVSDTDFDPKDKNLVTFVSKSSKITPSREINISISLLEVIFPFPWSKNKMWQTHKINSEWHRAGWLSLPQRLKLGADIWLWLCLSPAVVVIWWLSRRIRADLNTPGYLVHKVVLLVLWKSVNNLKSEGQDVVFDFRVSTDPKRSWKVSIHVFKFMTLNW